MADPALVKLHTTPRPDLPTDPPEAGQKTAFENSENKTCFQQKNYHVTFNSAYTGWAIKTGPFFRRL